MDERSISTWTNLTREAAAAERAAESALRRGFRWRAIGEHNIARVADRRHVEELTDARDLRATAHDLL